MKYIGCDFHPSFQQIAMLDLETGELVECKLSHRDGEAKRFYEGLSGLVVVGVEATGSTQWFETHLARLGHRLWMGDAAEIRRRDPRRQKHDRRDAKLILRLMEEGQFPRIWVPSVEERDLRQLLLHRHHLVRMRTRVKNQLQHMALNKVCSWGANCGARRDGRNWKPCRWRAGRGCDGMSCSNCWTNWKARSCHWSRRWSSKRRRGRMHGACRRIPAWAQ